MLEIAGLTTGYGETQIIHGLDLEVRPGRVHAVLGRNGVGKSTTLKAVMGLLPITAGDIRLQGQSLRGLPPHARARLGLAYVPETRDIFGALSVRENLALAGRLADGTTGGWTQERVLDFFPNLANRLENGGTQLSGGEQQMLAIGRALMANPRILILDEPTEGLAPIVIRQIFEKMEELKAEGLTMVLVEQNLAFALGLADEVSILGRGQRVWHGPPKALRDDLALHEKWLGV